MADAEPTPQPIPEPIDRPEQRRWAAVFSIVVSIALLVMVGDQLRKLDFDSVVAMLPSAPLFWICFAIYYITQPLSEWVIYRKLWRLPAAGIGALFRKLVNNELLLGYLGEAQFYAWARSRVDIAAAPFGAIKDVTILSALTGNIVTMIMIAFVWPAIQSGEAGVELRTAIISLSVVLVTSLAALLWRRRLFSLPRRELWFIAGVHFVRIVVLLVLAAVMWQAVLPQVPLIDWVVLATLRMLVSRLPLVPNKDVVFAGLAVFLLGQEADVADLMTMMAALILVAHLGVGLVSAIAGLIEDGRLPWFRSRLPAAEQEA